MQLFAAMARMIEAGGAVAVLTVLASKGSTPREAGARMVVGRDGGFHGTIGGGNLEWQALAYAQSQLASPRDRFLIRRYALGPELGQCCGGAVTVGFEVFTTARAAEVAALAAIEAGGAFVTVAGIDGEGGLCRHVVADPAPLRPFARLDGRELREGFGRCPRAVYLFGAGHVGRAVMMALLPLDFAIHWIDERADVFPPVVPKAVRVLVSPQPALLAADAPEGAFALVMTHSHALDLDIVHAALTAGRYAYVGMIGSDTKRARFLSRLGELGVDAQLQAVFHCPIGLKELKSKEPAVIAAGVASDLLLRVQALDDGAATAPQVRSPAARHATGERAR